MINVNSPGYTLLEILAVVAIIATSAAVMAPVFSDKGEQTRLETTLQSMAEIKKAILGTSSDRVRGDVKFAGYVQDMGELPKFIDGQLRCLWTNDPKRTPEDENDDLIPIKRYWYKRLEFVRVGWRGPYLKPPSTGRLLDGWGNPFVFENVSENLAITSLGADNKKGGRGFEQDVILTIRKTDYSGSVSGYVSPQSVYLEQSQNHPVAVRIYYTPATPGSEKVRDLHYMEKIAHPDGYFHFEGIPIGTQRLLLVAQQTAQQTAQHRGYKITVEPGIMWLGTLGLVH